MSIASNSGAESAATEISDYVRKKIEEYDQKSDVVEALLDVKKFADGIVKTAADGWY